MSEEALRKAAEAGWNACRRQVYLLSEDYIERTHNPKPSSTHEDNFYRGQYDVAKSFAKAFSAFEAEDCDYFQQIDFASVAFNGATLPVCTKAIMDVAAERSRQVVIEGWTPEHDDKHHRGEMAGASACYAVHHLPSVAHIGVMVNAGPRCWLHHRSIHGRKRLRQQGCHPCPARLHDHIPRRLQADGDQAMSETIIKSEFRDFHGMIVAKAAGCVVLAKSVDGHPTAPMMAIPIEDIPELIKALQPFANEVHERDSL